MRWKMSFGMPWLSIKQLKTSPELEPYPRAHIPKRVLAGLRASCLPLKIELGRFMCPNTPYDQWTCKMCSQAPEDRTLLLIRPALPEVRVKLFKAISGKFPTFILDSIPNKLATLLYPQNCIFCITMSIYELYIARQKLVFN